MEALDSKISALRMLTEIFKKIEQVSKYAPMDPKLVKDIGVLRSYKLDIDHLRDASAFAWFDPALAAVIQASNSIPHDVKLQDLAIPKEQSGWWWFKRPVTIMTRNEIDPLNALLWSMIKDTKTQRVFVGFGGYVKSSEYSEGEMAPTSMFKWYLDETIHEMMARLTIEYRGNYGPGGRYAHLDSDMKLGETGTIKAAIEIASIFAAGVTWVSQEILDTTDGPVERHERKRLKKEFNLADVPPVKIITLRHTHHINHTSEELKESQREYHYQWVVSGHWRNQPYGPGRLGRKLTYILPYTKGPEDAPLKPKQDKLYVVLK